MSLCRIGIHKRGRAIGISKTYPGTGTGFPVLLAVGLGKVHFVWRSSSGQLSTGKVKLVCACQSEYSLINCRNLVTLSCSCSTGMLQRSEGVCIGIQFEHAKSRCCRATSPPLLTAHLLLFWSVSGVRLPLLSSCANPSLWNRCIKTASVEHAVGGSNLRNPSCCCLSCL